MYQVKQSQILPYLSEDLFKIVKDVNRYDEFVPWCEEAKTLSNDFDHTRAMICLKIGLIRQSFTTQNTYSHYNDIHIKLINGPFRKLEGFWNFSEINSDPIQTQIKLQLDFEFSHILVEKTFGGAFHLFSNSLLKAFTSRAHKLLKIQRD